MKTWLDNSCSYFTLSILNVSKVKILLRIKNQQASIDANHRRQNTQGELLQVQDASEKYYKTMADRLTVLKVVKLPQNPTPIMSFVLGDSPLNCMILRLASPEKAVIFFS